MTGRGPIFWGQPEYTVGRSACTGLAVPRLHWTRRPRSPKLCDHSKIIRPRQNYATTGYTLDYCGHRAGPTKIIRPLGIHWTTTACGGHQSRPRQQNIRPLVAGPTKIIRPLGIYTELLRPQSRTHSKIMRPLGIHWTTAVRAALAGAIRVPLAALLYRPQGLALCVHNGRRYASTRGWCYASGRHGLSTEPQISREKRR